MGESGGRKGWGAWGRKKKEEKRGGGRYWNGKGRVGRGGKGGRDFFFFDSLNVCNPKVISLFEYIHCHIYERKSDLNHPFRSHLGGSIG